MEKSCVVVTGGAGYIGSHIVHLFLQKGYRVISIDHAEDQRHLLALPGSDRLTLFKSDFADEHVLDHIFGTYQIAVVIHCAAYIEVGESVKDPEAFYLNNVVKTQQLLHKMRSFGVNRCIFSSSCAVYGTPQTEVLSEDHPRNPVSPYGMTKYIVERMLEEYHVAYGFAYCSLRYFNAAGATPEYALGERHEPETHLIPRAITAAQTQQRFAIYGTDYPTPDGTCIRDYLHVKDLADAHWRAAEYLLQGYPSCALNLGTGIGFSVKEVVDWVQTKIGPLGPNLVYFERRAGDPARLIADATAARELLGWVPRYSSLAQVLADAESFMFQRHHGVHELGNELQ